MNSLRDGGKAQQIKIKLSCQWDRRRRFLLLATSLSASKATQSSPAASSGSTIYSRILPSPPERVRARHSGLLFTTETTPSLPTADRKRVKAVKRQTQPSDPLLRADPLCPVPTRSCGILPKPATPSWLPPGPSGNTVRAPQPRHSQVTMGLFSMV